MAHHDPISEMLTAIRNGVKARNRFVDLSLSRVKLGILKVFEKQGFIESLLVDEKEKKMRVFLKYIDRRTPLIQGVRRISKPSLRRYIGREAIPTLFGGLGVVVISTSLGIVDGETAKEKGIGGELLCSIW